MDTNALLKIGYGLYVLTTHVDGKDNGCIINTVMQLTVEPCQISICLNKSNYSCEMLQKSKKFNVSVLNESTDFETIKCFGYQSFKNKNKFDEFNDTKRALNGLLYITKNTNAYISAYVTQEIDLGSHILFIAQVVNAEVLNDMPTLTYDFYQKNIKPRVQTVNKKGWQCKICNYIYEEDSIPQDFICPICKHGVVDFVKL